MHDPLGKALELINNRWTDYDNQKYKDLRIIADEVKLTLEQLIQELMSSVYIHEDFIEYNLDYFQ